MIAISYNPQLCRIWYGVCMNEESRIVRYDPDLQLEAYHFQGVMQQFPNHFHDYYVIGYIEDGKRDLLCKGNRYLVESGDLTLFNPRDAHTCDQVDGLALDYRCLNIPVGTMEHVTKEIFGESFELRFRTPVVHSSELAIPLKELHTMILQKEPVFLKEEAFLLFMEQLIVEQGELFPHHQPEKIQKLQQVRLYLEEHYMQQITLNQLADMAGMSRYHLIREFSREQGLTPYQYLETMRIGEAKKLLERGETTIETALHTGFVDQSHFSKFFKRLIGLTPGQYRNIFRQQP